jgi:hypothetical protein
MEQHLGVWLWRGPSPGERTPALLLGFNALGGMAAPLFVTLAGCGAALAVSRAKESAGGDGPAQRAARAGADGFWVPAERDDAELVHDALVVRAAHDGLRVHADAAVAAAADRRAVGAGGGGDRGDADRAAMDGYAADADERSDGAQTTLRGAGGRAPAGGLARGTVPDPAVVGAVFGGHGGGPAGSGGRLLWGSGGWRSRCSRSGWGWR